MPVMYRGIALDQQTADADRAAIMQSGDLALQCKGENRLFLGRRFFVGWIVELGYLVFKTSQAEFSREHQGGVGRFVQVRPSIIPFRESQRAASPVSWRNELAASIFWPQQCAGTVRPRPPGRDVRSRRERSPPSCVL
jgi:hypothetical protein